MESGYFDNLILRSISVMASFTFNEQKSSFWKSMQLFLSWEHKFFPQERTKLTNKALKPEVLRWIIVYHMFSPIGFAT